MKVCVFGAGNMGARITEVFLNAGHDVTMIDIKPEFTERGKTVITHDYEFLVKQGQDDRRSARTSCSLPSRPRLTARTLPMLTSSWKLFWSAWI